MKLNKVLALALSGIMAVSMLAGCSGKTDDGKEEQVPATGIIAAVNNAQTGNVKINFTADSTLDTQLSKAVAACAEGAAASTVQDKLETVISGTINDLSTGIPTGFVPSDPNAVKDGDKTVGVAVFQVKANYTEAAALKEIATKVNDITSQLKANTATNSSKVGSKYVAYDYAGTVSMMQTSTLDGTTYYYAAIVITNTCTVKTVTV